MVSAILAVVGAIVGMVGGIAKSDAADFATHQAIMQGNVNYARDKEFTHYSAYSTLVKAIGFILIGGLVLIGIIYYLNK